MRVWLLSLLVLLVLCACGVGEKPEFVEVPSGDPMPPAGEGTPIQDADDDSSQSCGEQPPARSLPVFRVNPKMIEQKREEATPAEPQQGSLPTIILLLIPTALGWWLRRPR